MVVGVGWGAGPPHVIPGGLGVLAGPPRITCNLLLGRQYEKTKLEFTTYHSLAINYHLTPNTQSHYL